MYQSSEFNSVVRVRNLGLGATNLLPQLTGDKLPREQKIDTIKLVREFSLQDWSNIVRAFSNWKFAPDVSSDRVQIDEFYALACSYVPS
jgi:hypothetical protein